MNPSQSYLPRKRCRKIVNNQKEFLVNFMMQHPDFALSQNKTSHSRTHTATLWRQLKDELNKLGPSKNITQYKTVWKEIKSKCKKKHLCIMRQSLNPVKDFGDDYITDKDNKKCLTDIDNKVLSLMHQASSETGHWVEDADAADTMYEREPLANHEGQDNPNITSNEKEFFRSPSHESNPEADNKKNIPDISTSVDNLCKVLKDRNEIMERRNVIEEERNDIFRSALTLFGTLVYNFGSRNHSGSTT